MATTKLIKHNPMFLTEAELETSFVVREAELQLLLGVIRENTEPVNQHVIIIGTRGMGKTMLVRRLALAVRQDKLLAKNWYPVILPEEIYDVANEGEVWLRVLERIAIQEREAKRDHLRWLERYDTLRGERDGKKLRVQSLTALSEFAGERNARLLIVIENMQMLLGEQAGSGDAWDLRRTLLNNAEIMLVTTATTKFTEIINAEKANFELFREITLQPLSTDDCRVLWRFITGEELADERIRPMEILTGGSPRLLAILADFAKGRTLAELMEDLVILIDDHTTYFKANVESLPPMERRVFVTLAELWEPVEARQVAEKCRLDVNTTSAYLKKLVARGAVGEAGKVGRKNLYQIVERLYNIYHLMRLSGAEADRVRALVRFMVPIYGEERVARALADEACLHDGKSRLAWIEGYRAVFTEAARKGDGIERLRRVTPETFLALPEAVDIAQLFTVHPLETGKKEKALSSLQNALEAIDKGDFAGAISLLNRFLSKYQEANTPALRELVARVIITKGLTLGTLGRREEEIAAYDDLIRRFADAEELALRQQVVEALFNKGFTLGDLGQREAAIAVYDDLIRRFGEAKEPALREQVAKALNNKGIGLGTLDRREEAIAVYDDLIRRFGEAKEPVLREPVARALFNKGLILRTLGRQEEEIAAYDDLIHRFGETEEPALREAVARALYNKGFMLGNLNRQEEAIDAYDDLIRRFGETEKPALCEAVARALVSKGFALGTLDRQEEAIAVYDDLIRRFGAAEEPALRKQVARGLVNNGIVLGSLGRQEEAIAVFDDLISRFGKAEEPALSEPVARALVNKGIALESLGREEEAIAVNDDLIRRFGEAEEPALRQQVVSALSEKAWLVYMKKDAFRFEQAVADMKKALSILPHENAYRHTFASLLGLTSRWEEAFEQAKVFSNDDHLVNQCPEDIISFFIDAAAAGQAEGALRTIEGTKASLAMEPLVIALKMTAGKPYRAPREVEEVAKDICQKIRRKMAPKDSGGNSAK